MSHSDDLQLWSRGRVTGFGYGVMGSSIAWYISLLRRTVLLVHFPIQKNSHNHPNKLISRQLSREIAESIQEREKRKKKRKERKKKIVLSQPIS